MVCLILIVTQCWLGLINYKEDLNEWQACQQSKYHKIIQDAKDDGLGEAEIYKLFAANYECYEQDRVDAAEDLKDQNHYQQIMNKAAKKFSDLVNIFLAP